MEFHVEDHPDPADIDVLETRIRREASAVMGLGGRSGPGDLRPRRRHGRGRHQRVDLGRLLRTAEPVGGAGSARAWAGDAAHRRRRSRGGGARGCSQTVHFTYAFQARALYERNGYELVGCVQDFPSGTDVLWYRMGLKARADKG